MTYLFSDRSARNGIITFTMLLSLIVCVAIVATYATAAPDTTIVRVIYATARAVSYILALVAGAGIAAAMIATVVYAARISAYLTDAVPDALDYVADAVNGVRENAEYGRAAFEDTADKGGDIVDAITAALITAAQWIAENTRSRRPETSYAPRALPVVVPYADAIGHATHADIVRLYAQFAADTAARAERLATPALIAAPAVPALDYDDVLLALADDDGMGMSPRGTPTLAPVGPVALTEDMNAPAIGLDCDPTRTVEALLAWPGEPIHDATNEDVSHIPCRGTAEDYRRLREQMEATQHLPRTIPAVAPAAPEKTPRKVKATPVVQSASNPPVPVGPLNDATGRPLYVRIGKSVHYTRARHGDSGPYYTYTGSAFYPAD